MSEYAEMGGGEADESMPEMDFMDFLETAVRDRQGLQVETEALSSILKGIRRMEDRESRLRYELARHNPKAAVLQEPAGFRLIKPD